MTQPSRIRTWLSHHRMGASLWALVGICAVVLLVIPHGQNCDIPKDSTHEYCSFHNALSVVAFYLSDLLSDFGTVITGIATVAIAAFTATLWRATSRMQRATSGTLEHLRKEFLATHRPKLIVRRVTFSGEVREGAEVNVHVEIANVGESEAQITKLAVALKPNMLTHPKAATIVHLIETGIQPIPDENRLVGNGDSLVVVVVATDTIATALGVNRAQRGLYSLYCVGYVEYTNLLGDHRRRTGFIRCGSFETEYFERVKGLPDFEYAD